MKDLAINQKIKNKLMESWGAHADAMDCMAWVRYKDLTTSWACYIYALNPWDEDEIMCILDDKEIILCSWTLTRLLESYNYQGEHPVIDEEYRPMNAAILYKKLMGTYDT